jgi:ESCRT-II complex subunit VPS22
MQRHQLIQKRMGTLGEQVEAGTVSNMQRQIEQFQEKLQEFAVKHKAKINGAPLFRAKFHKMCKSIGVDPLASNKGLWAQSLGLGDFYYEV